MPSDLWYIFEIHSDQDSDASLNDANWRDEHISLAIRLSRTPSASDWDRFIFYARRTTVLNATLALRTSSQISRSLPMLMPACTLSASAAADHCTSQAYHVPPAGCLPSPGPRFYITLAVKTFPRSRPTPFIQRPSASAAAAPIALPVGPW
ncbi:hypothetical protein FB45DRAFT_1065927 [Roridomyces roridus]|uniref:Uncharacterized protein n=1 Tax=Roridomyces roridus TaxID=1738132 RepID=A0AAD7F9X4_9AGAR|nr:hypothetical protein FB45DRAFT_1065927 [Roridomyces roridus]